ncbi:integral membrane protein [Astrocystis sublimbata]|nr:integral membrane protein [Astrocystis sublimbata]
MRTNSTIEYDSSLEDASDVSGLFGVLILFTILISLSSTTRLVNRIWTKSAGWSDLFIFMGLVLNLGANALEFQTLAGGFGRHLQFLTLEEELTLRRLTAYTLLLAFISKWATQLSVAFFILTLIRGSHRRSQWVCYGLIVLTTAATIASSVVWGFQARPIQKLWQPEIPGTIAPPQQVITEIIVLSAINLVFDVFFALSPIYFFGRLQMDLRKKLIILTLTGLGLLIVIAAAFRLVLVHNFVKHDFTFYLPGVYYATIIERNFAQLIADIPPLYPILRPLVTRVTVPLSSFVHTWRHGTGYAGDSQPTAPQSSGRRTIVTIGSAGKRKAKASEFSELGSTVSEDQIHLRDIGRSNNDVC